MENLPIDTISLPSRVFYSPSEDKLYVGQPGDYKDVGGDYVELTGNQTIEGVKTFTSSPIVPTATTPTQAVNLGQLENINAEDIPYNNTASGLNADNVQEAIDEIVGISEQNLLKLENNITYTVGEDKDYETIEEAVESAMQYRSVSNDTRITILIDEGYAIEDTITFSDLDMGHIVFSSTGELECGSFRAFIFNHCIAPTIENLQLVYTGDYSESDNHRAFEITYCTSITFTNVKIVGFNRGFWMVGTKFLFQGLTIECNSTSTFGGAIDIENSMGEIRGGRFTSFNEHVSNYSDFYALRTGLSSQVIIRRQGYPIYIEGFNRSIISREGGKITIHQILPTNPALFYISSVNTDINVDGGEIVINNTQDISIFTFNQQPNLLTKDGIIRINGASHRNPFGYDNIAPSIPNTSIEDIDNSGDRAILSKEWFNSKIDSERYIRKVVGKNLFDFDDLLFGWRYDEVNGLEEHPEGILSNKLYLSTGIHRVSNVKVFEDNNNYVVLGFNSRDEVVHTITSSNNFNVSTTSAFSYIAYFRVMLSYDSDSIWSKETSQLEKGNTTTVFEAPIVKLIENPNYTNSKTLLMSGASTAMSSNGWFERACRELGYKGINVSVSGEDIMQHADKMWRGTLFTNEELDEFEILVLSHTHNYDVNYNPETPTVLSDSVEDYEDKGYDENNDPLSVPLDPNNPNHRILPFGNDGNGTAGTLVPNLTLSERYSAGFDYFIKKYRELCYNLKDEPTSVWFGSEYGKPCHIIIMSHWHDGYVVYNESAKELAKKHGVLYCDTAGQTGFTYKLTDPTDPTSIRWSAEVCNNNANNIIDIPINGVLYTDMGFHPTRNVNSPFNVRRANILKGVLNNYCSNNVSVTPSTLQFEDIDENTTDLIVIKQKTIFQFSGNAGNVTLPNVTTHKGYEIVVVSLDNTYGVVVESVNSGEILHLTINDYVDFVAVAPKGGYKFISNGSVWLASVNGL